MHCFYASEFTAPDAMVAYELELITQPALVAVAFQTNSLHLWDYFRNFEYVVRRAGKDTTVAWSSMGRIGLSEDSSSVEVRSIRSYDESQRLEPYRLTGKEDLIVFSSSTEYDLVDALTVLMHHEASTVH